MKDSNHFPHVFWFVVGISAAIMIYIGAATFIPIPDQAIRIVDSNIGYFQNILVAVVSFFVGSSIEKQKKEPNNNP